jgi:dUTP pyrophosphatase
MNPTWPVVLEEGARVPTRSDPGNAGYDLYAQRDGSVPPRSRALVPTGVAMALPSNTVGLIRPRSGLSLRHGIEVGAGVIDSNYIGSVGVLLYNHSPDEFQYRAGDRVAQMLVLFCAPGEFQAVEALPATVRGAAGFGSSGR